MNGLPDASAAARLMRWVVLALIFSWVGLNVFGAFLGAERAKAVFTSGPIAVYWILLAAAQAAGFFIFARQRRDPGLLAMHLGLLAIMLGFFLGSETAQRWTAARGGEARVTWAYLPLREGQTSSAVRDRSLRREIGALPFEVRLDAFEIEHYPIAGTPPLLYYGILASTPGAPHGEWQARALDWKPGRAQSLADTPVRVRVLEFTPVEEGAPVSMCFELDAEGVRQEHRLVCPPTEPFARLTLHPLFPGLSELDRSASLMLAPPVPAVRTYRSRVTVTEGGRERSAEILVNRPLRVGGYHLYQHAWGEQPERHTILLVVSHAGLGAVYAGFILLGAGAFIRFWRPRWRGAA
jgi:hypothetical protein